MDIHVLRKDALSSVVASESSIKRTMTRPPELRQPGYEDQYDFSTIFYSAFRGVDGTANLIGPPLRNFQPHVFGGDMYFSDRSGARFEISARAIDVWNGWLQTILSFPAPRIDSLELHMEFGALGQYAVPLPAYRGNILRDKRVALTMIKYDPLVWVRDWAEFYARAHGTNAVLIYNNQAPSYSSDDIAHAVSDVKELETVVIVEWPYKYGPQAGTSKRWDSVFCKTGAFQHARFSLLAEAASVVNTDVDELIVHPNGLSVHDAVERAPDKYLQIGGTWACRNGEQQVLDPDINKRRHRDFIYRSNLNPRICAAKWAVVPASCPKDSQWVTHRIRSPFHEGIELHPEFCFRHFRDLNSNWKGGRANLPKKMLPDVEMQATYRQIGWLADDE